MTFGERLRKARNALNLTQQKFADHLGLQQNTIATYEMNRTNPSKPVIKSICREFGINEEWLRTGRGEMFVPSLEESVDELIIERGLDDLDRQIILEFIKLKPEERDVVKKYVRNLVSHVNPAVSPSSPSPVDTRPREEKPVTEWTEADIDAEVADYRRQLLEEKRQAEGGPASGGSSGSTA